MQKFLIAGFSILVAACSAEPAADRKPTEPPRIIVNSKAAIEDARVAAVLLRADWCSSCKIMEPKLDVVKAQGPIDGLAYVTLDYTDRDKTALYVSADDLGVGAAIYSYLEGDVTTGIVLLVDLATNEVVGDLRKSLTEVELRTAMATAAA